MFSGVVEYLAGVCPGAGCVSGHGCLGHGYLGHGYLGMTGSSMQPPLESGDWCAKGVPQPADHRGALSGQKLSAAAVVPV